MTDDRRTFIRRAFGSAAALAIADSATLNAATNSADEPWLRAYAGKKHKAIIDVMEFFPDGTPFRRAKNLLNVLHESYGSAEGDIAIAVGMHGRGLAHAVSATVWADLGIADWLMPQLSTAAASALKASIGSGNEPLMSKVPGESRDSIQELRARRVHFLACRETINRWAQRKATQSGETVEAVTARIVKGLHEGVEPVPAMIAASVIAQEVGAQYVAVG